MIPTQEMKKSRRVFEMERYRRTGFKINKTTINFWFDLALLTLVLSTLVSAFVNISTHKWLGGSMVAAVSFHLALHRQWIQAISQRFLKMMSTQLRFKAVLDVLLLTVFLLLIMSGIIVSLIYAPKITRFHNFCFYIFISLMLFHLALNWKWIAGNVKRKMKSNGKNILAKELSNESTKKNK